MKTSINEFDVFSEEICSIIDEINNLINTLKDKGYRDGCIWAALYDVFLDESNGMVSDSNKLLLISTLIKN